MKKLLIVINNSNDVSHNQHLLRLIKFLSKENFEINLVILNQNGKLKANFLSIPRVTLLATKNLYSFLKNNKQIPILTKEIRSEYLIFTLRFVLGWSNYKHLTIRPSFGFLNESWWKIIKNILFYFSLFLVDLNIAVGKTVADRIIATKNIKKHKIICIPNSLSKEFLSKKNHHPINLEKLNFIYTGLLEQRKNIDYAIELFESFSNESAFTLLGDGPDKNKLMNLVKSKEINKRVHFLGHVTNIEKYLNSADIFLFLTKMEGLSLSLLEAMACGLVCVVSDIPENKELISDMKNGILLPLDNKEQAIKKLKNALKNKTALMEISNHAKQTIIDKYSDNKSFTIYKKVLTNI